MHYLIYKITNLVNGKIYIGKHKTNNIDDGYMGSGKLIKRVIEKYGLETLEKEILFEAESEEEMTDKERELVEIGSHSYNLKEGGIGGWDYVNQVLSDEQRIDISRKGGQTFNISMEEHAKRISDGLKNSPNRFNGAKAMLSKHPRTGFGGKHHSEEAKQAIAKKASVNQRGEKNSQYGTIWITNESDNRKIKKDDPIPEGWRRGKKQVKLLL
jgi:hypothetical protein